MSGWRGWLKQVIFCICFLEFLYQILPGKKWQKYLKFTGGLVFVLVLFQPVLQFFSLDGKLEQAAWKWQIREESVQLQEAQKELEDAGFKVISSFQYDDSVASGNVINTTPSAGTKAEKGSTVTMLVSQGTDKKTVPDVRGMADATAQSTIKNYGFNVGTVTYDYSDSVEKGMVISQTVTPGGKAAAGTTISITVSNGPKPEEKIDIQSFVGQQESALKSWASQNGLYTNVSDSQYSSSYAKGCIISMSPSSGNISKGGTISYVVSLGAKPQEPTNGGTTGDNNNQNGSNTNDGTTTGQ